MKLIWCEVVDDYQRCLVCCVLGSVGCLVVEGAGLMAGWRSLLTTLGKMEAGVVVYGTEMGSG